MLVALSFVSYTRVVATTTGAAHIQHTHQVIEKLSDLLSATQDIETGYRGFVIAGDERFLVSYKDGLATAPVALAAIGALTVDNMFVVPLVREF